MDSNKFSIYLLILLLLISPSLSFPNTEAIIIENMCIMGENDSRNDVRKMCFLEAKRKVLEKAGTFIERSTTVQNYRLSKDEISIYSAAMLKVETVQEKWDFVGDNIALKIKVKADVDTSYIEKQLAKISKDSSIQGKIKQQQARLQQLESRVVELQKQLGNVDASKTAILRKERNFVFKQIDELHAKKMDIMEIIKAASKNVLELIETNMTLEEVRSLIGLNRGKSIYDVYLDYCYNYGKYWICMNRAGLVKCISTEASCGNGNKVLKQ